MEQIYNEYGYPLDMSKISLLSDKGSEFTVYRYLDYVLKLYKKGYTLTHLSLDELNFLKNIATKRILMPMGTLWSESHELLGYDMPFITGERSIDNEPVVSFFEALEALEQDLYLLCQNLVILRDINLSNTIYNGQMYLVDPGNYLIGELYKVIHRMNFEATSVSEPLRDALIKGDYDRIKSLTSMLAEEERHNLVKGWNYQKINELLDMLLFSRRDNIDSFKYRQIVQFLIKQREKNGYPYSLDILKMYFDSSLCMGQAIDDFVGRCIEDDPEERKIFYRI